jgi:hypothetical protein
MITTFAKLATWRGDVGENWHQNEWNSVYVVVHPRVSATEKFSEH